MRALILFALQRKLHTSMRRMQLLGYAPQPGGSEGDLPVAYRLHIGWIAIRIIT